MLSDGLILFCDYNDYIVNFSASFRTGLHLEIKFQELDLKTHSNLQNSRLNSYSRLKTAQLGDLWFKINIMKYHNQKNCIFDLWLFYTIMLQQIINIRNS
jgi:hypothetical protein